MYLLNNVLPCHSGVAVTDTSMQQLKYVHVDCANSVINKSIIGAYIIYKSVCMYIVVSILLCDVFVH